MLVMMMMKTHLNDKMQIEPNQQNVQNEWRYKFLTKWMEDEERERERVSEKNFHSVGRVLMGLCGSHTHPPHCHTHTHPYKHLLNSTNWSHTYNDSNSLNVFVYLFRGVVIEPRTHSHKIYLSEYTIKITLPVGMATHAYTHRRNTQASVHHIIWNLWENNKCNYYTKVIPVIV